MLGALWLKRAGQDGVDIWRIAYWSNVLSSILFIVIGLCLWDAKGGGAIWQTMVTGLSFVAGQTLAFSAFKYGDVSIATPVLGLKILLVAVFTIFMLGDYGSWGVWAGAFLATLGIYLLSKKESGSKSGVGLTVGLSFLGACGYALFDVSLKNGPKTLEHRLIGLVFRLGFCFYKLS